MNLALKNVKLAILYGFFIWLVPFILSIIIFPIHEQDRPFFESIMPVVLVSVTVYLAVKYFKKVDSVDTLQEGLIVGVLWMLICIVIDLPLFNYGPMKMPFVNYWKDIGFTYLLIPIITSGFAMIAPKEEDRK
jgi:hypothetical protein